MHPTAAYKPCRTIGHLTVGISGKKQANPHPEPRSAIANLVLIIPLQLRCSVEPGQVPFATLFQSIFTEGLLSWKPPQ